MIRASTSPIDTRQPQEDNLLGARLESMPGVMPGMFNLEVLMNPPDSEEGRQSLSNPTAVLGSCTTDFARGMRAALFAQSDGGRRFQAKEWLRRCRFLKSDLD